MANSEEIERIKKIVINIDSTNYGIDCNDHIWTGKIILTYKEYQDVWYFMNEEIAYKSGRWDFKFHNLKNMESVRLGSMLFIFIDQFRKALYLKKRYEKFQIVISQSENVKGSLQEYLNAISPDISNIIYTLVTEEEKKEFIEKEISD